MRYLTRLFNRSNSRIKTLSEILASDENRETFLGMKSILPPSPEQIQRDAASVVQYSKSSDYAIWAKEAWSEILKCMDKLTRNNLSDREVDFYRGSLAMACDLLRISYSARAGLEDQANEKNKIGVKDER